MSTNAVPHMCGSRVAVDPLSCQRIRTTLFECVDSYTRFYARTVRAVHVCSFLEDCNISLTKDRYTDTAMCDSNKADRTQHPFSPLSRKKVDGKSSTALLPGLCSYICAALFFPTVRKTEENRE